jgi:hypothetical protein
MCHQMDMAIVDMFGLILNLRVAASFYFYFQGDPLILN